MGLCAYILIGVAYPTTSQEPIGEFELQIFEISLPKWRYFLILIRNDASTENI